MYRIAICDDCALDRDHLKKRIKNNPMYTADMRIVEFDSGLKLLQAIKNTVYNLIFLDIKMNDLCGEETARKIRAVDTNVILVFYTGYVDPSPKSFEVQPFRYIMKYMPPGVTDVYIQAAFKQMIKTALNPLLLVNILKMQYRIKADVTFQIARSKAAAFNESRYRYFCSKYVEENKT